MKNLRQHIFYVTSITFSLILSPSLYSQVVDYSSEILSSENAESKVSILYLSDLSNLKKASSPRRIQYIDAGNLREYKKIGIEGILFTFNEPKASHVYFTANTKRYRPQQMGRSRHGIWYYVYVPAEKDLTSSAGEIRYKFLADGFFLKDPENPTFFSDKGKGELSVFQFSEDDETFKLGVIPLASKGYSQDILFRFQLPDAARVELAGSFNHWNAEMTTLRNKGNGIFEVKMQLPPGKHQYILKIDGKTRAVPQMKTFALHPVYGRVGTLEIN